MALLKKPLSNKEISRKMKSVPEWQINKKQTELSRTFTLESYVKGLTFIAKIAVHAELINHHPVIEFSHKAVKIRLTTDDVKSLTSLDFDLAKRINNLQVS